MRLGLEVMTADLVCFVAAGRLISLTELQRLPVMYRCRLHKSAVTHAAFSPSGDCLVTAAAADKHVALLGLRGCEHTDMLGYFATAGEGLVQ